MKVFEVRHEVNHYDAYRTVKVTEERIFVTAENIHDVFESFRLEDTGFPDKELTSIGKVADIGQQIPVLLQK
jgi:hypothetical protein